MLRSRVRRVRACASTCVHACDCVRVCFTGGHVVKDQDARHEVSLVLLPLGVDMPPLDNLARCIEEPLMPHTPAEPCGAGVPVLSDRHRVLPRVEHDEHQGKGAVYP